MHLMQSTQHYKTRAPSLNLSEASLFLLLGTLVKVLPVVPKSTPADELSSSVKNSHLCRSVQSRMLTIIMRYILCQHDDDNSFASNLLDVGNESLPLDVNGLADISIIGNCISSPEELCTTVYPNLCTTYISHEWMCERYILAPTNATGQTLNACLLRQLPTQERYQVSIVSVTYPT